MNTTSDAFIPVSHLNAYVYCPRRFYLENNLGMFEDNPHTIEGRSKHRTVDGKDVRPAKKEDAIHRRSVAFSSPGLGISGKLDLLEEKEGAPLYPVEYKKGKKPKNRPPWRNDQVQLCAQAMLLAENGLAMPERAFLYYIGSRARVEVLLDDELVAETRRIIAECRLLRKAGAPPPLAENRNKCFGCSLNAICLPEEEEVLKDKKTNARTIIPMSLDGDVLYVDTPGAYLGLSGETIKVTAPGGEVIGGASLERLREVALIGPAQATTQTIHACMKKDIPIHYLSYKGGYVGTAAPLLHYHGLLRKAQWKAHFAPERCLYFSKIIVLSKIASMKTLLMRYRRDERDELDQGAIDGIKTISKKIREAESIDSLRGLEGMAAKHYFSRFEQYIKPERQSFFYFKDRNRRPPQDPVNALLSFGYSLLAKDCSGAAIRVGFDPFCGYYHTMKYGRPSLALDMMEMFRQPVVDSVVLSAINNGVFKDKDFYRFQNVCYLNEKGRKKYLVQYEMRKKDRVTHPKFHYRMSYERTIELQYRLLAKYLLGDIDSYEGFFIR